MPKNDPQSGAPSRVEQLRAKRKHLAERIQSLLAELESAEHEFDAISKELERMSKDAHGL
jgi:chromosome segregation ATPase